MPTAGMATPAEGTTIMMDRLLEGVVIFTDASWKSNKISGTMQGEQTGLGVYIRDNSVQRKWSIKIQAKTQQQSTVFQAEAKALLLAARIAKILQVDRPTFLTDNQVLAKTAAARRIDHPLLHWNARSYLADFFKETMDSSPQVFHISREVNGEAHNCPTQVFRPGLNQPIYRCTNSADRKSVV